MAVTVKKAVLWRKDIENRPGTLAETLKPLSDAGVSLQVLMGYKIPGESRHAAVEVFPVSGVRAEQAASKAGLAPSPDIACLLVQGDDRPGLGLEIAEQLAVNGINISFVMVQVTGTQYLGIFGFESQTEAQRASAIIKDASKAVSVKKAGTRKTTVGRITAKKSGRTGNGKVAATKESGKKPAVKKAGTSRQSGVKTAASGKSGLHKAKASSGKKPIRKSSKRSTTSGRRSAA